MSLINPTETIQFGSAKRLLASIKTDLSTYDAMGLINEQKLYKRIRYILSLLGLSVYKEYNSIIPIDSYMGKLPENFAILHGAYRMKSTTNDSFFQQPLGKFTYYITEECSTIADNCNIQSPPVITPISKIEYKTSIKGEQHTSSWSNAYPMKLSSKTPSSIYSDNCINVGVGSADEFALDIELNKIYTNFQQDTIYLQYYGIPVDSETNLPQIPEPPILNLAVEEYLKYKILEDIYFNSDIQDIERKYQKTELNYRSAIAQALHYVKLNSFQSAIQQIRLQKSKFSIYQL